MKIRQIKDSIFYFWLSFNRGIREIEQKVLKQNETIFAPENWTRSYKNVVSVELCYAGILDL